MRALFLRVSTVVVLSLLPVVSQPPHAAAQQPVPRGLAVAVLLNSK